MQPIQPNGNSGSEDNRSFQEIVSYPAHGWFPTDAGAVKQALTDACYDYRGWPFVFCWPSCLIQPQYGNDLVYSLRSFTDGKGERFNYFMFDYKEGIFYAKNLRWEYVCQKGNIFDPRLQVGLLSEAVVAAGRIYDGLGLGLDTELAFAVRYTKMRGVSVASIDEMYRFHPSGPFASPVLTSQYKGNISDFINTPDMIAGSIAENLLVKMGFGRGLKASALAGIAQEFLAKGHRVD